MSLQETFRNIILALGIGGGAGYTVAEYVDTEDRTEEYSVNGTDSYRNSDISRVDTWYLHHTAQGDLDQAAAYHKAPKDQGGKEWDGIAYVFGLEDPNGDGEYNLINTRPIDTKGNQAARNNTDSRGLVVEGNFNEEEVSEDLIWEIKTWLYATLKLYPRVNEFSKHGDNQWSNTDCPGSKLVKAMEKENLFFKDRSEIQWFMKQMENRLRNPCLDEVPFEDTEGC